MSSLFLQGRYGVDYPHKHYMHNRDLTMDDKDHIDSVVREPWGWSFTGRAPGKKVEVCLCFQNPEDLGQVILELGL